MKISTLTNLLQILLPACLLLFSCTDRISHGELIGAWQAFDYGDDLPFYYCSFTATEASFTGEFSHPYTCSYDLQNGVVQLSDSSLTHNLSFSPERINGDTLYLKSGSRLIRTEATDRWPVYELPSVPGGAALPPRQKSTHRVIFHYYQDTLNSEPVLRCGDRIAKNEEIRLALYQGHAKRTEVILFADRSVSLARLRQHYFELKLSGLRSVYLITDQQGFDEFTYTEDRLPIWWDELQNVQPPIPLPPPPLMISRSKFLTSADTKQVDVTALRDTSALAGLSGKFTYLVSLSSELDISDYLWIKRCLARHRKQDGLRFRLDIVP